MQVNFYKAEKAWEFEETGKILGRLELNEVPVATVLAFAKEHGKSEYLSWEDVPDEERDPLLQWFETEIFPGKEFGKALLEEYLQKIHKVEPEKQEMSESKDTGVDKGDSNVK